ncbi:MAG: 5-formyltetrahydrofolate cyclo-ligase [Halieaceae bacterium]|nr:5-formyltetrahydrofolate cyclo-ligase [Halieaceae bacterium]
MSKRAIRADMRARRRSLSDAAQRRHALLLAGHIARSQQFRRARRVAMYWACDGEIDLAPVMRLCWRRRKQVYLPRLLPGGSMEFAELKPGKKTVRNRFGIPEPALSARKGQIYAMDLVLAPLVAFTRNGERLGMGGGYYDRALQRAGVCVVGVAHSCQQVEQLPRDPWDVAMKVVITEKGAIRPPFLCVQTRKNLL